MGLANSSNYKIFILYIICLVSLTLINKGRLEIFISLTQKNINLSVDTKSDDIKENVQDRKTSISARNLAKIQNKNWMIKYNELLAFHGEYGHSAVPSNYKENNDLIFWVRRQRQQYRLLKQGKPTRLTKKRLNLLNNVDFLWEGHLAALEKYRNEHISIPDQKDKKQVIIVQKYPSHNDRMGSTIRRPLYLMAYAHNYGYHFCIRSGSEGISNIFSFPICQSDLYESLPVVGNIFEHEVNQSGIYEFQRIDKYVVDNVEKKISEGWAFSAPFRDIWRSMIITAPQRLHEHDTSSLAITEQNFFQNPNATTVAVHIRRGDIGKKYHNYFIRDETYIALLTKVREMLLQAEKIPEIHIFSEDYGDVNWAAYDGLVDYFHLAPATYNVTLNLRDWLHFVKADVLVTSGSFSIMPGFARSPPDKTTGFPLTLFPYGGLKRKEDIPPYGAVFSFNPNEPSVVDISISSFPRTDIPPNP